jgi:hypothetical protein
MIVLCNMIAWNMDVLQHVDRRTGSIKGLCGKGDPDEMA